MIYSAADLRGLTFNIDTPPAGARITTIQGPRPGAIGSDTAAHGDFDGDGIDDLMIGNPHDEPQGRVRAGTMHVFYGQAGGWPAFIDTSVAALPGPSVVRIAQIEGAKGRAGADEGDILCYSAAAADVAGDGRPDLVTNEMQGNGSATVDAGNLIISSGGGLLVPSATGAGVIYR